MESVKRIEGIGFRKVGSWSLVSGEPVFTLTSSISDRDVLYAFVTGGEVLYIGKTTLELRKRMYGYQRPGPTQRTNIAGRASIAQLLGSDRSVDIYALCNASSLRHGEFEINLAAGLEDALIRELRPPWNKRGK